MPSRTRRPCRWCAPRAAASRASTGTTRSSSACTACEPAPLASRRTAMTQEPDDPKRAVGDIQTVLEQAVRRASVTRTVVVDPGALARLPQVLAALGPSRAWQVVADPNTMAAAGHGVVAALCAAGIETAPTIVLDELPRVKPRAET